MSQKFHNTFKNSYNNFPTAILLQHFLPAMFRNSVLKVVVEHQKILPKYKMRLFVTLWKLHIQCYPVSFRSFLIKGTSLDRPLVRVVLYMLQFNSLSYFLEWRMSIESHHLAGFFHDTYFRQAIGKKEFIPAVLQSFLARKKDLSIKEIGSPNAYFLRSIKLKQYFHSIRQCFLTFFVKKILNNKIWLASMKILTNTEICTESNYRILPRLTISVISWFSPRDHLSLYRVKVGLNIHVMGSLRNNYRITSG